MRRLCGKDGYGNRSAKEKKNADDDEVVGQGTGR